jgi:protease-4
VVNDTYDWFKRMVADRRKLSDAELGEVSSGRVFSGRQGIGLKLVDARRRRARGGRPGSSASGA